VSAKQTEALLPSIRTAGRTNTGHVSLFRRVFVPNALVLVAACLLLILSPVTVSSPVALHEALTLALGIVAMLLANLFLMRRAFGPLERLTSLMRRIDPLEPGRRIETAGEASEVVELTRAFNDMLDRVEKERRESALRTLSTQESDRRRLARELHDELGQVLTALVLRLKQTARDAQPPLRTQLTDAQETARSALDDVRGIVRQLRPEALDDLGLVSAVAALSSGFSRRTGMRVDLDLDREVPSLGLDAELVVYRVTQESLTNAARHSGSEHVSVQLKGLGAGAELTVRDRGRGAPAESLRGSGIRGMRERALAVGANLAIDSLPGAGTEVRLSVPGEAA
jgi:two-component system, NarL family, sensor histidine kinase UhpB